MKTYGIREAKADDCELIRSLAAKVWNPTYKGIHSQEQLDYMFENSYALHALKKQMEEGQVFYIGYEYSGIPIGYFSIEQKEKDLFYLNKLYILPGFQGKGAGKFLFQSAIDVIKKEHPEPCLLELNVNRRNKAVDFYESLGMRKYCEKDESIGNGYITNSYYMRMGI